MIFFNCLAGVVTEKMMMAIINSADKDGDHEVNYHEFIHALHDWGHHTEAARLAKEKAADKAHAEVLEHHEELFWRLDHKFVSRRAQVKHWNRKYVGTVTGWMSANDNGGEALWHFKHDFGQHKGGSDSEDLDEDETETAIKFYESEGYPCEKK